MQNKPCCLYMLKIVLLGMGEGQRPYSQLPLYSDCTKKVRAQEGESAIEAQQGACGKERT